VDAKQALADLTEISSQIRTAVVLDAKGALAGSTIEDEGRAGDLARAARELLAAADAVKADLVPLTQLEAATAEGNVFVVRDQKASIAATTAPNPTVGLVFYDLKSALRDVKPKPPASKRKAGAAKKEEPPAKKPASNRKTSSRKKAAAPRKKKTDAS